MICRCYIRGTNAAGRGDMNIIMAISRVRKKEKYMPIVQNYMQLDLWVLVRGKVEILTTAKLNKQVSAYYKQTRTNEWCEQVTPKLIANLCRYFFVSKYGYASYGTLLFKARKYVREMLVRSMIKANGRGLEQRGIIGFKMECTMMDTLIIESFANKLLSRKHSKTTITIKSVPKFEKVQCLTMSRQEIARAVKHIQEAPPTNELAELQAFIEAQNANTGILYITEKPAHSCILNYLFLLSGQSTIREPHTVETSMITPTTATENPGYTTQRDLVIREPMQFQYIYDPVNDIMKRVEKKIETARDVGAGKQGEPESTGKRKQNMTKRKNSSKIDYFTIAETESPAAEAEKLHDTAANDPASASTISSVNDTSERMPVSASATETDSNVNSQNVQLPDSEHDTDMDQLSCSFSSEEEIRDKSANSERGSSKDISSEKHARLDSRIAKQKAVYWKGKEGLKGNEDPRQGAIIPIHAPKMERMSIANLKALEKRAKSQHPPPKRVTLLPRLSTTLTTVLWQ